MPLMWTLAKKCLREAYIIHPIELVSFVLMGNHYHMILYTPNSNIDLFMYEFNKRLALEVKKHSGNINRIFGGRYKWCLIRSHHYFSNCYRYVYQNPMRAGIVANCEDYPYGTLNCVLKNNLFPIPIHDRFGFKDGYALRWLNQKINEEDTLKLKKLLYRAEVPADLHSAKSAGTLLTVSFDDVKSKLSADGS
jgi:putative transposase